MKKLLIIIICIWFSVQLFSQKQGLQLIDFGFITCHSDNGQKAYEMVQNDPVIDLIFMDIKMLIMDGFTASRLIKELRPNIQL